MTPKTINYVDQEKQDNFSCKHENTLKSMEFYEGDEQLCRFNDDNDVRLEKEHHLNRILFVML